MLIVIAIIGLLAGGIVISLSYAQKRGRDAQRIADMNSVATALSAYYADKHVYPQTAGADSYLKYDDLTTYLSPTTGAKYLQVLPQEESTVTNLQYQYGSSGGSPC